MPPPLSLAPLLPPSPSPWVGTEVGQGTSGDAYPGSVSRCLDDESLEVLRPPTYPARVPENNHFYVVVRPHTPRHPSSP